MNTGHDVTFMLEKGEPITMLGGPFAYTYRIYQIKIHFGSNYAKGSEHSIAEKHFPVEVTMNVVGSSVLEFKISISFIKFIRGFILIRSTIGNLRLGIGI